MVGPVLQPNKGCFHVVTCIRILAAACMGNLCSWFPRNESDWDSQYDSCVGYLFPTANTRLDQPRYPEFVA